MQTRILQIHRYSKARLNHRLTVERSQKVFHKPGGNRNFATEVDFIFSKNAYTARIDRKNWLKHKWPAVHTPWLVLVKLQGKAADGLLGIQVKQIASGENTIT